MTLRQTSAELIGTFIEAVLYGEFEQFLASHLELKYSQRHQCHRLHRLYPCPPQKRNQESIRYISVCYGHCTICIRDDGWS